MNEYILKCDVDVLFLGRYWILKAQESPKDTNTVLEMGAEQTCMHT